MTGELRTDPVQQRGVATLEHIKAAAVDVYNAQGRDGFKMNAVAKAAHVSIGTLFRYFENKSALLDAIHPDREQVKL